MRIEESCVARRRFLCTMVGGGMGALAAGSAVPLIQYAGNFRADPPPDYLELPPAEYDVAPGKSKMLLYGRIPVLLIGTLEPAEPKVFVAICTHLSCTVHYVEERRCIACACHGGDFDLEGRVLAGPPPQPLRKLYQKMQNGNLIIALEQANLDKAT
jgi:cytochrome b6-f complex iron-sulfur subunit